MTNCSVPLFMVNFNLFVLFSAEENYMSQSYHPGSSAHRRRTDLMPTITFNAASPASGLSRSSTPGTRMLRSPGKAVSMSRLDALSKPRNHINSSNNNKALHENQKQLSSSPTSAHQAKRQLGRVPKSNHSPPRKISQSMSHLGPRIKPKLEVAKGECSRTTRWWWREIKYVASFSIPH